MCFTVQDAQREPNAWYCCTLRRGHQIATTNNGPCGSWFCVCVVTLDTWKWLQLHKSRGSQSWGDSTIIIIKKQQHSTITYTYAPPRYKFCVKKFRSEHVTSPSSRGERLWPHTVCKHYPLPADPPYNMKILPPGIYDDNVSSHTANEDEKRETET